MKCHPLCMDIPNIMVFASILREIFLKDMTTSHIWHHKGDHSIMTSVNKQHLLIIPPRCTFLMTDISRLKGACQVLGKYDLIVLDPPWKNESVKRKRKYNTLDNEELLALPLEYLMSSGCLVVVWVTNKHKNIHFVTKQLFPRKHIQHVASWYWLKVTRDGQCVQELDSLHKKPYETLLIGKYRDLHLQEHSYDPDMKITNNFQLSQNENVYKKSSNFQLSKNDNDHKKSGNGSNCLKVDYTNALKVTDDHSDRISSVNASRTCECQLELSEYSSKTIETPEDKIDKINVNKSIKSETVTMESSNDFICNLYDTELEASGNDCNTVIGDNSDRNLHEADLVESSNNFNATTTCQTCKNSSRSEGMGSNRNNACQHENSGHRENMGNSNQTGETDSTCVETDSVCVEMDSTRVVTDSVCGETDSTRVETDSLIPDNKVIISVPCSLHSKKPPLLDVLRPYLPDKPRCLELFARNLQSNWTSWGNEVLLHQHVDLYEPITGLL